MRCMQRFTAHSAAAPGDVWPLLARPDAWATWSPHVRGAWGLGGDEVREGARGAARLFGAVPVPARITSVVPGRSWTWQVGPVRMEHAVDSRPRGGSDVSITLSAPPGIERALAALYGPVITLCLRRLARLAAVGSA
jgi:hypothetical protein